MFKAPTSASSCPTTNPDGSRGKAGVFLRASLAVFCLLEGQVYPAAFSIATGATAANMDVTMFFTFWGLLALKKKTKTGKSYIGSLVTNGFLSRLQMS